MAKAAHDGATALRATHEASSELMVPFAETSATSLSFGVSTVRSTVDFAILVASAPVRVLRH